ncbi:hypothetical protein QYF36_021042 [Acer negundo]|nr:hypothetical protein QYF36_021042 [Acer negundo]
MSNESLSNSQFIGKAKEINVVNDIHNRGMNNVQSKMEESVKGFSDGKAEMMSKIEMLDEVMEIILEEDREVVRIIEDAPMEEEEEVVEIVDGMDRKFTASCMASQVMWSYNAINTFIIHFMAIKINSKTIKVKYCLWSS